MHQRRNHKEESDVKTEETFYCDQCNYIYTKNNTLRAHFIRNHKELEETSLECDSCDYTWTKKYTLRMHKGVKHIGKLSNCDKRDYSCTKNNVLLMHKFKKPGGQDPPRELYELCDFTCLTNGGLRFHTRAEHSGLEGPQEFKCALCDYTA